MSDDDTTAYNDLRIYPCSQSEAVGYYLDGRGEMLLRLIQRISRFARPWNHWSVTHVHPQFGHNLSCLTSSVHHGKWCEALSTEPPLRRYRGRLILHATKGHDIVLSSTLIYRFSRQGRYMRPSLTLARDGCMSFYPSFLVPRSPTHLLPLKLTAIGYRPHRRLSIIPFPTLYV